MTAAAYRTSRRSLLALGALAACAAIAPRQAEAQPWPQKPITLIVSQAAGATRRPRTPTRRRCRPK